MITKNTHKKLTWIDLESPTKEEIFSIIKDYDVPQIVAEELTIPTMRTKVDIYKDFIYIVLHFPAMQSSGKNKVENEQEIDFILKKDILITTHYEFISPLYQLMKTFEVKSILDKDEEKNSAGFLFLHILREFYKNLFNQLDYLNDSLVEIKENIFKGREKEMVTALSNINHKLLDYKQTLRFQGDVLRSFETASKGLFTKDFSVYVPIIVGEYNKLQNTLEGCKEMLDDLRETNDSLLKSKTNETIKKLTVLSVIILPLTLVVNIFVIADNSIVIHNHFSLGVLVFLLCFFGLIMFLYFKKKKWI